MTTLRLFLLAALAVPAGFPATLAVSTYFKDGFTPTAMASDAQGNVFVAGSAVIDPVARTVAAAVAKLDPKASQFLFLAYLDSAASDQVSAIAVDGAGNAYVTGSTSNPNFPAVGGGSLGTAPTGSKDQRPFVTKLSPDGAVLFSVLVGGSVAAQGLGIAVTPQGRILVSGLASASGFPATPGAYSVPDSNGHWFLMELDAAASKVIFFATGIGGSSLALDSAGNIFLAGSSTGTDYPTTPGAYQTAFVQGHICSGLCQLGFAGGLQHITKVDSTGSTLLYSTGLNDPTGLAGSTVNTGLAVDAAGNAFVTGTLTEAAYPFTVPPSVNATGYVSKIDPTGASLLFSVPVGGGGVALDSSGAVYVGGVVSSYNPVGYYTAATPVAPPATFSWVPQPCWPNNTVAVNEAYILKLDPATGSALDGQWIDGSTPTAVAITVAGGKVWTTGGTPAADVPLTPNTLSPAHLGTGFVSGAYLTAADFSAAAAGPAIGCVLDSGNLEHVRALAAYQVISLFGANLGPSPGFAPAAGSVNAGGLTVTFNGIPAPLLYVSASQINVEVPAVQAPVVMQAITAGTGSSTPRQFPLASTNLNLFANLSANEVICPQNGVGTAGFQPVAVNADGSLNGCATPATFGATVSFFLDGAGAPGGNAPPPSLPDLQAFAGGCSAPVENTVLVNDFLYRVDVQLPAALATCYATTGGGYTALAVTFSYKGAPVGPLTVPYPGMIVNFEPGDPMPMIVWVKQP